MGPSQRFLTAAARATLAFALLKNCIGFSCANALGIKQTAKNNAVRHLLLIVIIVLEGQVESKPALSCAGKTVHL